MRIDPKNHAWLAEPETVAVMQALGNARFVGGAVRNALLGAPVADIDIAVPVPPEQTVHLLEAAGIKAIPTGFDHGTVTAIRNNRIFEVTSLRRDVATDGRHAVVSYTTEWDEDAARRDFTINALYAAADGEIFDYTGGLQDLIAGRVRFVGNASARIAEDYLRILRLFRFHAWYGKGEMDAEALRAAAEAKGGLKQLSGERIAKELQRLLECPNPAPVLRVMAASGILPELLPFALQLPRLERLIHIDSDNLFAPDAMLRLAALLPDNLAAARAVADRLKLSGADRARLENLAGAADGALSNLPAIQVKNLLYKIGADVFRDRVRLAWAAAAPGANAIPWRMLMAVADAWKKPRFPLTGRDVMQAGVPQGPGVGEILDEVENWWIENDFPEDESVLAERLKAVLQAHHR
ncbi:MAG TPA: CCA tRNA nucleotidyltransferase [Rhizomicrobium sp.]|nr:CCA tRNA nucleotidyltransferase [Rhizomicrobium sp.]